MSIEKQRKLNISILEEYIVQHYIPEYSDYLDYHISDVPEEAFEEDVCAAPAVSYSKIREKEKKTESLCGGILHSIRPDDIRKLKKEDLDISFGEALELLVKEKGLTGPQFQARANISPATYSNIIRNRRIPKKTTVLACPIGLRLNLEESEQLLKKAGYTFSDSELTDVIVKCYIENMIYDIDEINAVLFEKDLQMLGQVF